MKRELVLHIGLPKTGTTSIQFALGAHRAALLEHGVHYPTSPGKNSQELLAASLLGADTHSKHFFPAIWEGMAPEARIARFRREFHEELSNLPLSVRTVLISSEHCSMFLDTPALIEKLARVLDPYFDRFQIIAYLRRQDLFEASIYNERLKVGSLGPPVLFGGGPKQHPQYDYETVLNRWATVFGEAAITVRIFERSSLLEGDVINDFLATCGIDLKIPMDHPRRSRNISMRSEGQALLNAVGKRMLETQGPCAFEHPNWRQASHTISMALPGTGWLPTRSQAADFMSRFAASNEAVRRRFLPDRATLFAEGFENLPESPSTIDSETLLNAAIDAFLQEIESAALAEAALSVQLARLNRQLGNEAAYRSRLVHAIWRNPKLVAPRLELAAAFLKDGDLRGAREHVAAAEKLDPASPHVQTMLHRVAKAEAG